MSVTRFWTPTACWSYLSLRASWSPPPLLCRIALLLLVASCPSWVGWTEMYLPPLGALLIRFCQLSWQLLSQIWQSFPYRFRSSNQKVRWLSDCSYLLSGRVLCWILSGISWSFRNWSALGKQLHCRQWQLHTSLPSSGRDTSELNRSCFCDRTWYRR